jgi:hypothetical protein
MLQEPLLHTRDMRRSSSAPGHQWPITRLERARDEHIAQLCVERKQNEHALAAWAAS